MNESVMLEKMNHVMAGNTVVMSNAQLDWLIDNDKHPADVVSIKNPQQVGILDAYVVAKSNHPVILAERAKVNLQTSATRTPFAKHGGVWDEPQGASTPRGWYWPEGSTQKGTTGCAGHYLDYGPDLKRFDKNQETEPGTIHCVVFSRQFGTTAAFGYVETVEAARAFIEREAARFGHTRS